MTSVIAILVALIGQDPSVLVGIKGVDGSSDYATVRKELQKTLPGATVRWWMNKGSPSAHICLGEGKTIKLSSLENALAEARKSAKAALNFEVDYRLDEDLVPMEGMTRLSGTGTQDRDYLERMFTLLPEATTSDLTIDGEGWKIILAWKSPGKLSSVRKIVEKASLKLVDVELPARSRPPPGYECPRGCSMATVELRCPECAEALKEAKKAAESSGG